MTSRDRASASTANPFVGPRPFLRGETLHGRAREVRELFYLLAAERIVWLYSPSGAGKTSLVQAGLVEPLGQDGFEVWPTMRVSWRPESAGDARNRYLASVVASLEEGFRAEGEEAFSGAASAGFADYVAWRRQRAGERSVVLLFDQFEEILTADPLDVAAKHEFFRQVGELLRDPELWALFILREDYLASLDPYVDHIPTRLANTFRLDLLDLQATQRIAIASAAGAGRTFADDAVSKLAQDLATVSVQRADGSVAQAIGLHVEPVQLQVVCRRLWQQLPTGARTIELEHVEQAGDVDSALAAYYARQVAAAAEASGVRERFVRDWFDRRLITEQGIRAQVLKGRDHSEGLDNRAVRELVDAHLVRSERRRGATWFELAHDRLVAPVRRSNADWRAAHLNVLQRQAELWQRQGRSRGLLLAGDALEEAERWAETAGEEMAGSERDLLDESLQARRAAERERRQAARVRRLAAGASVLAVLALVAFAFALRSYLQASRESRRALSRQLAAQSAQAAGQNLDLGLLLALEATRVEQTAEARGSLLAALARQPRVQRILHGTGGVASVAASPDGEILAAGLRRPGAGTEPNIMLWYLETGRQVEGSPLTLEGVLDPELAISPDGRWLAAGGRLAENPTSGRLGLWDLAARPVLPAGLAAPDPGGRVNELAFCGTGERTALAWTTKSEVRLWRPGESQPTTLLDRVPVRSLAWAPGCGCLAAGHERGAGISLLAVAGGDSAACGPRLLEGRAGPASGLAFSPGGDLLAAARQDEIQLIAVEQGSFRGLAAGHFTAVAFSLDGSTVAAAAGDGSVRLMRVDGEQAAEPVVAHDGEVSALTFAADGRLISGGEDGKVIVRGPHSRLFRQLRGHEDEVWGVAFAPDGRSLASGGKDAKVMLWDLESGVAAVLPGTSGQVRAVAFSPDGRRVVAGSRQDGSLHLWRLGDGADAGRHWWTPDRRPVDAVAFSPDGRALATAVDRKILLWSLDDRAPEARLLASHEGDVWSLAFRDGGRVLAASDAAGEVRLWRLPGGEPVGRLFRHAPRREILVEIAQSPGGELLAAASRDGGEKCVYLWRADRSRLVGSPEEFLGCLPGHQAPVTSAAFSGEDLLVSADLGGELIFWDLESRQEIGRLQHGEPGVAVNSLAESPDGHTLASASDDHTIRLWDLDWRRAACDIAGRNLTESEWRTYVGGEMRPGICP